VQEAAAEVREATTTKVVGQVAQAAVALVEE